MSRQTGSLLLEMVIALAIFAIGILGFFSAYNSILQAGRHTGMRDRVNVAFRNAAEALRSASFAAAYSQFNGAKIPVAELEGPGGGPAAVEIACFVDETALPAGFGPVRDLDGDGLLKSTDCSNNYLLLPVRLRLDCVNRSHLETRQVYVVLSRWMSRSP